MKKAKSNEARRWCVGKTTESKKNPIGVVNEGVEHLAMSGATAGKVVLH